MDDFGKWYKHDGHICWMSEDKERFSRFVDKVSGQRAVTKSVKWYKTRSGNQNRYMHWLFGFIADHTGDLPGDMKGYYKVMFNIKKTSELNTLQEEEFLEKVRFHAQTFFGICCPLPNEIILE